MGRPGNWKLSDPDSGRLMFSLIFRSCIFIFVWYSYKAIKQIMRRLRKVLRKETFNKDEVREYK